MLDSLAIALQLAVAAYLVLGEGPVGKYLYEKMVYRAPRDPGARAGFYRAIIVLEWGLVGLLALAFFLEKTPLALLGLRPLQRAAAEAVQIGLLALLVPAALVLLLIRFVPNLRASYAARLAALGPMLPTTGRERLWLAAASVTAGICEEVLFRGFLLYLIPTLIPGVPGWVTLPLSAAIFGLAHLYQGWKGVLQTGFMGLVFAFLYQQAGSLYPVMILHAFMDLNLMLVAWVVGRGTGKGQFYSRE